MPGGHVHLLGVVQGSVPSQDVVDVFHGLQTIRSLSRRSSAGFYDEHAPKGIDMNSLRMQGPILRSGQAQAEGYKRGIRPSLWL